MKNTEETIETLLKDSKKKIALIIKTARNEKGISQSNLGECIGMSQNTINRIENGIFFPEMKSLLLILNKLEIKLKINEIEI